VGDRAYLFESRRSGRGKHFFKNAVEPARRAVQIDPQNVQTRWLYYEALSRGLRDTTRAIDQLNAIVRLAPRDLNAYQHLFQIYGARGQHSKVITLLDSIVAMPGLMGSREKLFAAESYHTGSARLTKQRTFIAISSRMTPITMISGLSWVLRISLGAIHYLPNKILGG